MSIFLNWNVVQYYSTQFDATQSNTLQCNSLTKSATFTVPVEQFQKAMIARLTFSFQIMSRSVMPISTLCVRVIRSWREDENKAESKYSAQLPQILELITWWVILFDSSSWTLDGCFLSKASNVCFI